MGKGAVAGYFEGDVLCTGNIQFASGADCAEYFGVRAGDSPDPGTVMVLSGDGTLEPSTKAYDKRVAGIVSGAMEYKPAIILDTSFQNSARVIIALVGKTYCKVDARLGSIEIGDMLTTSQTLGHAMKATDPNKAFGAVIGKALQPLRNGQGLIPVLVALQ